MKNDESRTIRILCIFGLIPVIWLALLVAPAVSGGLPEILQHFPKAMETPFHIELCQDSKKTVLIFMLIYGLGIGVALSSRHHYRRGEEHGSAKWGSASAINRKYRAKDPEANKVFTKHIRMGLDGRKHRRNLNTVVVGGSGSGKSRFYALINLLQACCSYFVLDCKGELLRMTGNFLKKRGYEIKVLDLLSMEKSHCFNPFAYLETDNDVQKLVTSLFKATTPKGSQSNDPFWDTAASMLLSAIIFYLLYEAPEEEQNFPMVMEMLRAGEVREDDDTYQSPLDELFERLEMRNPDHIAVKYYKDYHSGSAKTLKSIQITLAARLEKFNLASVAALTATDELELASLGEKKVALFALIPDHDVSFNFLVSMVYSCTFEQLFRLADDKYKGALPVPVHFLMDEFANVSLPDDFDKLLATMRSRNVFVSIIIQNIAQLKNLFEKQWESILGNCDEFLYGWDSYGDMDYVPHVLRYYPLGQIFYDPDTSTLIVEVARSQIGNIGGEPYWSWYGFTERVDWCACFVSWCANQCGYIEAGVIPKFSGCEWGVYWFRQHDQWAGRNITPTPGMIIFFDWEDEEDGGLDGGADHVGIVERVENGRVYTIEGNTADSCRERSYPLGHFEILGYGLPAY